MGVARARRGPPTSALSVCGTKAVRDKLGISKGCRWHDQGHAERAIGVHQELAGEVSPLTDQSMREAHAGLGGGPISHQCGVRRGCGCHPHARAAIFIPPLCAQMLAN